MNRTRPFRPIRRLASTLAALATALLAATAAAPVAFAHPIPLAPGRDATGPPPPVHTMVVGGMPGWQIALIAVAAAAVAAAAAVLFDRARAARRHQPAPSA
jgi:anti-sigma-K factor RskA